MVGTGVLEGAAIEVVDGVGVKVGVGVTVEGGAVVVIITVAGDDDIGRVNVVELCPLTDISVHRQYFRSEIEAASSPTCAISSLIGHFVSIGFGSTDRLEGVVTGIEYQSSRSEDYCMDRS